MKRLRLTRPAARQLDRIFAYIQSRHPDGAQRVRDRIRACMAVLPEYPETGLLTSRAGLRRVLATPYPYAIIYRIDENEIVVLVIRHTARRPL